MTSAGAADDMADYTGLPREKINVVPSPVIPKSIFTQSFDRPDHSWFRAEEPPVILGVGELCRRKDFATLLRAFQRVRSQRLCRLLILGKGNQRDNLIVLASELGVSKEVYFAGFQPDPYKYMKHAALFAFTSKWEGLGFVLIEALAVGTPVVSTDCPSGPREILQDGKYGALVPIGDDRRLAQAMIATLDCPLPSGTLQEAAKIYDVETSTSAYLDALGLSSRVT